MALPYQYTPLFTVHDDETRLLHLEPGSGDDPIHFTLHPVRLSDEPSYEAISYCWGDSKDTREMYCEGGVLHVTVSLYTALKRLRAEDGAVRVLWADAVCINQGDTAEKNKHVRLMSRIYSQPTAVLVWLGDDTSGLAGLHESIKGALALLPPERFAVEDVYPIASNLFVEDDKLRSEGKPNLMDHDWRPIASVVSRPWFDRRWIIQEVTLADDSVPRLAMCGDIEFSWTELASVAYRLLAYNILGRIAGVSTLNSHTPCMMAFLAGGGRPFNMLGATCMTYLFNTYRTEVTLVDVVTATSLFKCTKSSDHLYSVLSLPQGLKDIEADYDLPMQDVCVQFALATLVADQNLRPLSLAPCTAIALEMYGEQQPTRLDLPSWVPDLSCQGLVNPLVSFTIRPQLFHAGGHEKPTVSVSSNNRLLHLQGRIVDKVAKLARCLIDVPYPSEDLQAGFHAISKKRMSNWFRECREVAGDKYRRDGESNKGFLETLLLGMTGMRDPLTDEVRDATQVYIDHLDGYFSEGHILSEEDKMTLLKYGMLVEEPLSGFAQCRRFCRTEQGRLGQVRKEAREGDVFACILGAEVPYLLRPSGEKEGVYTLVGDAFLLGAMQGETLSDARYETVEITIE